MLKMIDVPPTWLAGCAALAWLQARHLPIGGFGAWADALGALAILTGLGLMGAAVIAFRRHRTTVIPKRDPSAIITTGVFALSRNPIYLGDALVLLGLILRWDAVPSLVLVPAFILLIQRRFIAGEEARLAAAFPDAFAAYRAKVRRWV